MGLVLLVEDESAVLDVLCDVVESLGHCVLRARDGAEALRIARARRPDAIVTDHMMPHLSGVELCRATRAEAELCATPVILMSAVRPDGLDEADEFLAKPFDIEQLEAVLERQLRRALDPDHEPGRLSSVHSDGPPSDRRATR